MPNKVVFSSFHGAGYGCNPKYVAEALLHLSHEPLDLVWLSRRPDPKLPCGIRHVSWGGVSAAREWASARVWVDNTRTRRHVRKKPGQFYVQTWHGSLSPKPIEADIEGMLSRVYVKGAQQDSRDADLLVCNNDLYERVMRTRFWYDGPVMRSGVPRNAALLNPSCSVREKVRCELGIAPGTGVCLYAPTFRGRGGYEQEPFDMQRCCQLLEQRYGMPFAIAFRVHPNDVVDVAGWVPEGAVNASFLQDSIEALLAADVLITDYSSVAEDFALLGRPGYQFVPEGDPYLQTHDLYYPLESRPYPLARTEAALFSAILSTEDELFEQKRDGFFAQFGYADDGMGDEAVARVILDVIHGKEEGGH